MGQFQLGFVSFSPPMPQIEYLMVQEDQSEYKIHVPELTSDLLGTCKIDDFIQEVTADIRQFMSLDSSLPITVKVYTVSPPLTIIDFFLCLSITRVARTHCQFRWSLSRGAHESAW